MLLYFSVPTVIDRVGIKLDYQIIVNSSDVLSCPAIGIPLPNITWYRNGEPIDYDKILNIRTLLDGKQLEISNVSNIKSAV